VLVWVKVKVADPLDTPVITPALVTVATAVLLLAQVPPVVGVRTEVPFTQMVLRPVRVAVGNAFTVIAVVGAEIQPAVLVKVKVADPLATPVTTPAAVTVATAVLLLAQVPPVVGERAEVVPTQIGFAPLIVAIGNAFMVMAAVGAELQPVLVFVKIKEADPLATPVTTPASVTVATAVLLLAQVPPVVGERVVVEPTQMAVAPLITATGNAFTVIAAVGADGQPELV
jgi:hypothetical protein